MMLTTSKEIKFHMTDKTSAETLVIEARLFYIENGGDQFGFHKTGWAVECGPVKISCQDKKEANNKFEAIVTHSVLTFCRVSNVT